MAIPAEKSPEVNHQLDEMAQTFFGRNRLECIKKDICVSCGHPAVEFKDEESEVEFTLSGFCQTCQDDTFGE